MKRIYTLLALAAFALTMFAQSPDLMTYQAVLRDAENHLLTNQAVAVQISIIQGAPNSSPVYSEVHTLSTNDNGLVSLEIGDGVSGDDFSLVDWSSGPYFLKTETDPAGGSNYTITSTSQLLSVPFAKYADEAGNAFSGNYADLTGTPDNVSAFTNDAAYLSTITGSETAFNGWDKDETDDFSGNYADLTAAPTNVSAFTNDAAYLTSDLWSQNGSDLYHLGGNIGIGTSTPDYSLSIYSGTGNAISMFRNNATGSSTTDGLFYGILSNLNAYSWNYEAGPIIFGTNNTQRMIIEPAGDVGIGTTDPTATLEVQGDTKFGSNGVAFNELREVTGTTHATLDYIAFSLPAGYTETNTRVLSVEINYNGDRWAGLGLDATTYRSLTYTINGTVMTIWYPDLSLCKSRAFRVLIMQIAP